MGQVALAAPGERRTPPGAIDHSSVELGDVVCAGPSRRFPVGDLLSQRGAGSPTGAEASHLPAGTGSCVQPGNGLGEA